MDKWKMAIKNSRGVDDRQFTHHNNVLRLDVYPFIIPGILMCIPCARYAVGQWGYTVAIRNEVPIQNELRLQHSWTINRLQ